MSALSPRERVLALAVAAICLMIVPATASAGTVTKAGDTITYQAAAEEDNSLVVTQAAGNVTFDEQLATPVVDGGGCPLVAGNAVCPEAGVTKVVVNLGDLDDGAFVQTSALLFTITGGPGRDGISGGTGNDTLRGDAGDDSLGGGDGNDTLEGDDGNDQVSGGLGNDTITLGNGSDTANGEQGNDTISGGQGQDGSLRGDTGNDTISGDAGSDSGLDGGTGNDTISGGDGDDQITADEGTDVISGGPGRDGYNAQQFGNDLTITLDDAANDGAAGDGDNVGSDIEDVTGGTGNDTIVGSGATNTFNGGDGNDSISGGDGPDTANGGEGNDTVNGDGGGDTLAGGNGDDVVNGGADADLIRAANGGDVLNGGDGADLMEASAGTGADTFNGGAGADTVSWRDFELPVVVSIDGAANDGFAGAGDNVATDVETVIGSSADDVLTGGPGSNVIDGGFGNDAIAIRDGAADVAVCGEGADSVTADRVDSVDQTCESVDRGATETTGRRIGRTGSATHRKGIVTLTLNCPLDASVGCAGDAVMTSSGLGTIGRASFLIQAGSDKAVKISLSKKARSRLNSKRKLKVSLRLTGFDLRGALVTRTVTFTIKR